MKALMFYDRRDIRLEDIPVPSLKDDEVLIRVTAAGLSQSQISEFIEGPFILNSEPHPKTGVGIPMIPSQEYGGTITEVGNGVLQDLIGKTVAVLPLIYCGECEDCKAGNVYYCKEKAYYGLVGAHGGFCEYSAVKADNIIEVHKPELLTFVEPLLVATHSYNRYKQDISDKKVLILGAGAVGVSCAAFWKKMGAKSLHLYEHLPERLSKAKACGIDVIENMEDIRQEYDVVIDAAGKDAFHTTQAFEQAHLFLKPGGNVILIGTYFSPLEVLPLNMLVNEISYVPSYMYDLKDVRLLEEVLHDLDFDFDSLIKRINFDNIVQEGYYQAELDRDTFVRIVTSAG
ncbi:alcohol dehydrogenase catalytic domain-containing protein [Vibrio sp. JC009]|uniref:zinc-dependent alcohol dehydrogenase n=1 Tax=Vibrio sp. JC009 TaxID=2912314 RepID=UPI0023B0CD67|nr:alcohol dehydrogenase catalytic domain-containing protein [Vibrio sp. JC009]WED20544.1 alcohol dehydrogenase catalytic domain-containing protein [Vibrio sp. JC009]